MCLVCRFASMQDVTPHHHTRQLVVEYSCQRTGWHLVSLSKLLSRWSINPALCGCAHCCTRITQTGEVSPCASACDLLWQLYVCVSLILNLRAHVWVCRAARTLLVVPHRALMEAATDHVCPTWTSSPKTSTHAPPCIKYRIDKHVPISYSQEVTPLVL